MQENKFPDSSDSLYKSLTDKSRDGISKKDEIKKGAHPERGMHPAETLFYEDAA